MKLVTDGDKFDELQPWFVGDLIERIRDNLIAAGVRGGNLKDLCGNIAFSVCSAIDSTAGFEVDGVEYSSFLAFSENSEEMFYPGGNSFLHEYVFGVLDQVFEDDA